MIRQNFEVEFFFVQIHTKKCYYFLDGFIQFICRQNTTLKFQSCLKNAKPKRGTELLGSISSSISEPLRLRFVEIAFSQLDRDYLHSYLYYHFFCFVIVKWLLKFKWKIFRYDFVKKMYMFYHLFVFWHLYLILPPKTWLAVIILLVLIVPLDDFRKFKGKGRKSVCTKVKTTT